MRFKTIVIKLLNKNTNNKSMKDETKMKQRKLHLKYYIFFNDNCEN